MVRTGTNGVTCPKCGGDCGAVKDSRPASFLGKQTVRRRRQCSSCGLRETTHEITDTQITTMRREIAADIIRSLLEDMTK